MLQVAPIWVRGLKCVNDTQSVIACRRTHAGAWIEMGNFVTPGSVEQVAPCNKGAWIEM